MTRIDFHVHTPAKLGYACRIARKGHAAGHRMVFHADDPALLERFDRELWTFSDVDFIPHCLATSPLAHQTPILLAGPGDSEACVHHEIIVNLARVQPDWFGRFERMIELVEDDPVDLEAGRLRWKFYRDRGYPLKRIQVGGTGPLSNDARDDAADDA